MELLQVALHADDLDRAAAFYTRLLGAEPAGRFEPPGLLFFRAGRIRLLFERGAPPALVYLQVPDLAEALARVPDSAEPLGDPQRIFTHPADSLGPAGTEEWHAGFRDPDGNLVVLVALTPAGDSATGT